MNNSPVGAMPKLLCRLRDSRETRRGLKVLADVWYFRVEMARRESVEGKEGLIGRRIRRDAK